MKYFNRLLCLSFFFAIGYFSLSAQTTIICEGDSILFFLEDSMHYETEWQQSLDSDTWEKINIDQTKRFWLVPQKEYYYRAKISNPGCDDIYSGVQKVIFAKPHMVSAMEIIPDNYFAFKQFPDTIYLQTTFYDSLENEFDCFEPTYIIDSIETSQNYVITNSDDSLITIAARYNGITSSALQIEVIDTSEYVPDYLPDDLAEIFGELDELEFEMEDVAFSSYSIPNQNDIIFKSSKSNDNSMITMGPYITKEKLLRAWIFYGKKIIIGNQFYEFDKDGLKPVQKRIAYVWGAKNGIISYYEGFDLNEREYTWYRESGKENQQYSSGEKLFGLDCSGYIFKIMTKSGFYNFKTGRARDQKSADYWNQEVKWLNPETGNKVSLLDLQLKMIEIGDSLNKYFIGSDALYNNVQNGDLIWWANVNNSHDKEPFHIGLVVKLRNGSIGVLNSNGKTLHDYYSSIRKNKLKPENEILEAFLFNKSDSAGPRVLNLNEKYFRSETLNNIKYGFKLTRLVPDIASIKHLNSSNSVEYFNKDNVEDKIKVKVLDSRDKPIPGIPVNWQHYSINGKLYLNNNISVTNSEGIASFPDDNDFISTYYNYNGYTIEAYIIDSAKYWTEGIIDSIPHPLKFKPEKFNYEGVWIKYKYQYVDNNIQKEKYLSSMQRMKIDKEGNTIKNECQLEGDSTWVLDCAHKYSSYNKFKFYYDEDKKILYLSVVPCCLVYPYPVSNINSNKFTLSKNISGNNFYFELERQE